MVHAMTTFDTLPSSCLSGYSAGRNIITILKDQDINSSHTARQALEVDVLRRDLATTDFGNRIKTGLIEVTIFHPFLKDLISTRW